MKRAQVILASAQGFTPPKIAVIALMSEDYVRTLIKAFNLHGFKMLEPKWGPGRPSRFTEDQRKALVDLALSHPKDLGLPYTQWSLSRLREEAMRRGRGRLDQRGVVAGDPPRVGGEPPVAADVEGEPDPEREVKKAYIEKLTRMPHNPPVVLSGDEIGPIQLDPARRLGVVSPRSGPGGSPPSITRSSGRPTTS